MRLCYGPSKRLNFVQFMIFAENSTNLDYWKIDTSDSCQLPPYFYIWWTSVLLSLRKVVLPRLFSGSETFTLAMAKTICKLLRIHNAFGIQIQI